MNIALRIFLVIGAVIVFAMVIRKIRKSEMQASDSVFWLLFAGAFVVVALIPQIAFVVSDWLGFDSPSNFVFLFVIAILFIKAFTLSADVARLRQKVVALTQEIALREKR